MTQGRKLLFLVVLMFTAFACRRPDKDPSVTLPPQVDVIHPARGDIVRTITLPGDLVGFYRSTLYAKVTGYLSSISVDKGDWVKTGQVLAVIEVPELDQQLSRARANLKVQSLAYQRLESVWRSDSRLVARQDVDIANGKYLEAKANVEELLAMVGYTRIIAPFDGIVTDRFVDPGALIHAGGQTALAAMQGSSRGSASPVVSISRLDKLRIYVYMPQSEVGFVRRGMNATLTVQGLHGARFSGTVARFSHSLDLGTRTMLTEVDLENPEHKLFPGMYANVTLVLQSHPDVLRIPKAAVGGQGQHTVLLVRGGRLAEVPVTLGLDDGSYVEIVSGLASRDLVVPTFSNSLESGELVRTDLAAGQISSLLSTQ